jgi:hypothetical protein
LGENQENVEKQEKVEKEEKVEGEKTEGVEVSVP